MNVTYPIDKRSFEEQKSAKAVLRDFLAEGFVGITTVILTIIGLSGFSPEVMLSIATIVIGIAFLLEAGAVSTRFRAVPAEKGRKFLDEDLGVGVAAEFFGAAAGILLGVLSLIGLSRMVLVSIAVTIYGFTLILNSGTVLRFNLLLRDETGGTDSRSIRAVLSTAANFEFLFGLSVVILGIIALSGSMFVTSLNLAALLILGVNGFLTAASVSEKLNRIYKRETEVSHGEE